MKRQEEIKYNTKNAQAAQKIIDACKFDLGKLKRQHDPCYFPSLTAETALPGKIKMKHLPNKKLMEITEEVNRRRELGKRSMMSLSYDAVMEDVCNYHCIEYDKEFLENLQN